MAAEPETSAPGLLRELGLKEAIALHMGVIIGSGIFIVPAAIARELPAVGPMLLVWLVAGLLTLFGALSLAELSALLPEAGGPYVYLKHAFGKVWGFLFSWNDFFINKAGSLAAIAIGFATYFGFFTSSRLPVVLSAIVVIAIVTVVNVLGVRFGAWVMNVFTAAKVFALLGLVGAVAVSGRARITNLQPFWPSSWTEETTAAFGVAMISALWAYDGWVDVTLTAGETKDPRRNVPLALLFGTLGVLVIYLSANLAFAMTLPIGEMAASPRVAADVARTVLGPVGSSLVVLGILCSTFGAANGMALAGPRSIFAAGRDGAFAPALGYVHPRFRSPYVAVLVIGIWASLLSLTGSYEQITAYVVFGSWFFYALTALAVIVLRRKLPEAPRPYRAWGYPWATLLFAAVAGWFLWNTLREDPRDAMIGLGLLLLGLPFYFYWSRRSAVSGAG